jgi:hypothetical protein
MAADPDYTFYVESDTMDPFGPVFKENLDITRLVYDFTCWLAEEDEGTSEPISAVSYPIVGVESNLGRDWQVDYPLGSNATPTPISDDYPLSIQSVAIASSATEIEVRVSAGTPGITYVVSVIASSATTKRRKQVDTLVTIEEPLNPNLLAQSAPDITDVSPPLTISGDYTLPLGFAGRIYVENEASLPITITLPVTPTEGQRLAPVDILGNAATYPITYAAATGDTVYTAPSFVSDVNYDDLIFEWVGDHWIVLASRYTFLA